MSDFNFTIGDNLYGYYQQETDAKTDGLLKQVPSDNLVAGFGVAPNLAGAASNTLVGINLCPNLTSGDYNTVIGHGALHANATGNANTAYGGKALENTTGSHNVGIGNNAGSINTSGEKNTFVGDLISDIQNTVLTNCMGLGYDAGSSNSYNSGFSSTKNSNLAIFGNNNMTTFGFSGPLDGTTTIDCKKTLLTAGNVTLFPNSQNVYMGSHFAMASGKTGYFNAIQVGLLDPNPTGYNSSATSWDLGRNARQLATINYGCPLGAVAGPDPPAANASVACTHNFNGNGATAGGSVACAKLNCGNVDINTSVASTISGSGSLDLVANGTAATGNMTFTAKGYNGSNGGIAAIMLRSTNTSGVSGGGISLANLGNTAANGISIETSSNNIGVTNSGPHAQISGIRLKTQGASDGINLITTAAAINLTTLGSNANINLTPNGIGKVVVGGGGLSTSTIYSSSDMTLSTGASANINLTSGTGGAIIMNNVNINRVISISQSSGGGLGSIIGSDQCMYYYGGNDSSTGSNNAVSTDNPSTINQVGRRIRWMRTCTNAIANNMDFTFYGSQANQAVHLFIPSGRITTAAAAGSVVSATTTIGTNCGGFEAVCIFVSASVVQWHINRFT